MGGRLPSVARFQAAQRDNPQRARHGNDANGKRAARALDVCVVLRPGVQGAALDICFQEQVSGIVQEHIARRRHPGVTGDIQAQGLYIRPDAAMGGGQRHTRSNDRRRTSERPGGQDMTVGGEPHVPCGAYGANAHAAGEFPNGHIAAGLHVHHSGAVHIFLVQELIQDGDVQHKAFRRRPADKGHPACAGNIRPDDVPCHAGHLYLFGDKLSLSAHAAACRDMDRSAADVGLVRVRKLHRLHRPAGADHHAAFARDDLACRKGACLLPDGDAAVIGHIDGAVSLTQQKEEIMAGDDSGGRIISQAPGRRQQFLPLAGGHGLGDLLGHHPRGDGAMSNKVCQERCECGTARGGIRGRLRQYLRQLVTGDGIIHAQLPQQPVKRRVLCLPFPVQQLKERRVRGVVRGNDAGQQFRKLRPCQALDKPRAQPLRRLVLNGDLQGLRTGFSHQDADLPFPVLVPAGNVCVVYLAGRHAGKIEVFHQVHMYRDAFMGDIDAHGQQGRTDVAVHVETMVAVLVQVHEGVFPKDDVIAV